MPKKTKKKLSKADAAKEKFLVQARAAFAFLERDFGFQEEPIPLDEKPFLNQFAVWYASPTTRIVVEGINWGTNTRVALGRAGSVSQFENYDFGDLLAVRAAKGGETKQSVSGEQLEQLRQYAALLPETAAEFLRGDHSIFPELEARVELRRRAMSRKQQPSLNEVAEACRILGRVSQSEDDTPTALTYYERSLSTLLEIKKMLSGFQWQDTTEIDDLDAQIDEMRDLISKLEK